MDMVSIFSLVKPLVSIGAVSYQFSNACFFVGN